MSSRFDNYKGIYGSFSHVDEAANIANISMDDWGSLFPIAQKIAASTIATNLVSVSPMDMETKEQKAERERLIRRDVLQSIVDDTDFVEQDYHKPKTFRSQLFYLDCVYGSNPTYKILTERKSYIFKNNYHVRY